MKILSIKMNKSWANRTIVQNNFILCSLEQKLQYVMVHPKKMEI